jgi:hypothetical protein
VSAAAGPLLPTPHRLTAALVSCPSPAPRSHVAPPVTHPPPRRAAIKAFAADCCPFSPPRYFLLGKPARSSPPRPLYLLSTPANWSTAASPRFIVAATIFFPIPVRTALEALPAKWPCPSPSSLPPRDVGAHRRRRSLPERGHPRRNVVAPPHLPPHCCLTPLVSHANILLAW